MYNYKVYIEMQQMQLAKLKLKGRNLNLPPFLRDLFTPRCAPGEVHKFFF